MAMVEIKRVRNGFLLLRESELFKRSNGLTVEYDDMFVFDNFENMSKWLKIYMAKKEPANEPE